MAGWIANTVLRFFVAALLFVPISSKRDSPTGRCNAEQTAYYVSDNTSVNDISIPTRLRNVAESHCLRLCTNNENLTEHDSTCAYAVYEQSTSTCELYSGGGKIAYRSDVGKRLFEKFCLPGDLSKDCISRQFVRVNEYILKGYAQTTATFPTLAECTAHCVRETEFRCKSAMYFYEEGECITNSESAITKPEDFMRPDEDEKVIFIHNGCINHVDEHVSQSLNQQDSVLMSKDESPAAVVQDDVLLTTTGSSASEKSEILDIKDIPQQIGLKPNDERLVNDSITSAKPPALDDLSESVDVKEGPRLYGAKQLNSSALEKSTEHSFNKFHLPDNGPEHAPSGHLVIEDIVLSANSKVNFDGKHVSLDNEKPKANIIRPPGIAPPESGFAFTGTNNSRKDDDDELQTLSSSPTPSPNSTLMTEPMITTTSRPEKAVPHAVAPKSLAETKSPTFDATTDISKPTDSKQEISTETSTLLPSTVPIFVNPILTEHTTTVDHSVNAPINQINQVEIPDNNITAFDAGKIAPTKELHLKFLKNTTAEEWELFSAWSDWTPCHMPGERIIRRRKCLDLRRCRDSKSASQGELERQTEAPEGPPVRSPLPVTADSSSNSAGLPPSILPNKLPEKKLKPLPAGAPGRPDDVWSPWVGGCQQFVSKQPCKQGRMIGFESRECIAQDPSVCKGPFFRYCSLPC